jgi:hypothetical protein
LRAAKGPLAPAKTLKRKEAAARRKAGRNLVLFLLHFELFLWVATRQDTLRFLRDTAVPVASTQAERDGRMMRAGKTPAASVRWNARSILRLFAPSFQPPRSRAGTSLTLIPKTLLAWQNPSACRDPSNQPRQLPAIQNASSLSCQNRRSSQPPLG